jgi:hypothetical protein
MKASKFIHAFFADLSQWRFLSGYSQKKAIKKYVQTLRFFVENKIWTGKGQKKQTSALVFLFFRLTIKSIELKDCDVI